ncbi:hypothetical protein AOLI_G00162670 [Acnodon oligacanthus]
MALPLSCGAGYGVRGLLCRPHRQRDVDRHFHAHLTSLLAPVLQSEAISELIDISPSCATRTLLNTDPESQRGLRLGHNRPSQTESLKQGNGVKPFIVPASVEQLEPRTVATLPARWESPILGWLRASPPEIRPPTLRALAKRLQPTPLYKPSSETAL